MKRSARIPIGHGRSWMSGFTHLLIWASLAGFCVLAAWFVAALHDSTERGEQQNLLRSPVLEGLNMGAALNATAPAAALAAARCVEPPRLTAYAGLRAQGDHTTQAKAADPLVLCQGFSCMEVSVAASRLGCKLV